MPSDEIERLLRDVRLDQVAPVRYSRKTLSARVVLLMVLVLRAMIGRR